MGIVVGADGSAAAAAAVRWAAAEAARGGAELRVVLAYHWHLPTRPTTTAELDRAAREEAERTLAEAVAVARGAGGPVRVEGEAVLGMPADTLLKAAAQASLVVVGATGHHGFAAALLGSVGLEVATYSPCPVVVVRGQGDAASGPVLAAVDGSDSTESVLSAAFEAADRRGCDLRAVRVHAPEGPLRALSGRSAVYDPADARAAEAAELDEQVGRWRARFPGVRAEARLVDGRPAHVLVDEAREARLVVAGHRAHGGLTGPRLGSVSHALLHHADCPVLITRRRPAA